MTEHTERTIDYYRHIAHTGELPEPEAGEEQDAANTRVVMELSRLNFDPPHCRSPLGHWMTFRRNEYLWIWFD
jgi:hypothetical protein